MGNIIVDINEKTVEAFIKKNRPSVEIRDQLDLGYSYNKGIVEIFEIRPRWDDPTEIMQMSFAKIKFVKTQMKWKLYWMRASGKWESYEPHPESSNLEELLKCIDEDKFGCFKG